MRLWGKPIVSSKLGSKKMRQKFVQQNGIQGIGTWNQPKRRWERKSGGIARHNTQCSKDIDWKKP